MCGMVTEAWTVSSLRVGEAEAAQGGEEGFFTSQVQPGISAASSARNHSKDEQCSIQTLELNAAVPVAAICVTNEAGAGLRWCLGV